MSFGWLGIFREGQWRELRRFVLEQRRDMGVRLTTIEAELTRIGDVTTLFSKTEDGVVLEDRLGILVSPANSSLAKLMGAYVVQGGNPLDISLFLKPGKAIVIKEDVVNPYPFGGVLYPQQDDHSQHRKSRAGMLPNRQYMPGRLPDGRSSLSYVTSTMADQQQLIRRSVSQEIRRRNDLEERIVKLCDLREQLERELRDILVQAVGGTLDSFPQLDAQFTPDHLMTALVAEVDKLVWVPDSTGRVDMVTNNEAALAENPNIVPDLPGEEWSAL